MLTCTASGVAAGIWYVLDVLRRCDTLQRGAGGIIAAFVGLVSVALEWDKTRCKRLYGAVLQHGKIKALHPQQMQGKRKTPPRGQGGSVSIMHYNRGGGCHTA